MSEFGWIGARVKHIDGREGKIVGESSALDEVRLRIVDTTGGTARIILNSTSRDSGETGWSWMFAREGDPERWGLLGDHNRPEK